jgi:cytosine/adenosine deaminase-related metal-dependent hydrolase
MEENPTPLQQQKRKSGKLFIILAVLLVALAAAIVVFAVMRWQDDENYAPAKRLINDGYVITMDPELGNFRGDVLLDGDKIVEVAPEIKLERGVEEIDASNMIVMPGMIDNHRHMWQGVIHGMATDLTFGQYFQEVLFGASTKFTPEDVRLGNLMASYEAIDSGVTTVLDWSHINLTRDHALSAIDALDEAKIRAVYAYAAPVTSTGVDGTPTMEDLRVAKERTENNPLLSFAVGTNTPEINPDTRPKFLQDIERARELDVPITMHAGFVPGSNLIKEMHDQGLLRDDMTFVHANKYTEEDFKLIAEAGAHVSSSPESEIQMDFGNIPLAAMLEAGVKPTVSLDTPSTSTGDLFSQLRMLIQTQRFWSQEQALANGSQLQELPYTLGESLAYVTTNAAEALGLEDQIGSLTPGKQADLIMVRDTDLNIFLDKPEDAIVQANPGNVDTVIIAGRILKRRGELVNLSVDLDDLRNRAKQANERLTGEGE